MTLKFGRTKIDFFASVSKLGFYTHHDLSSENSSYIGQFSLIWNIIVQYYF